MSLFCQAGVTKTIKGHDGRHRLCFQAEWLPDMGFSPGALVQFIPEEGGALFVLCNENIASYSLLYAETKAKGGVLMQASPYRSDRSQLCVSGSVLAPTGLQYGDNLITCYEYGRVHMRKLPDAGLKVVESPMKGKWLADLGFNIGEVLTVEVSPGKISCTLQENARERSTELVKFARLNKLKLIQVRNTSCYYTPALELPPNLIQKAGFTLNEPLLASCAPGLIQLQRPDFVGLGF